MFAFNLRAADATAAFDSSNALFEQGKFADAAAGYEALMAGGQQSPALWFNLGNASLKAGKVGRAIAAYREAEKLTPRDPDIRANLQFARNLVQGPTFSPSRGARWLNRLTINEWTLLTGAALWFGCGFLILGQIRPAWRTSVRGPALICGLATLLLGGALWTAWRETRGISLVVVTVPDAVVRHGPLDESPSAFTVHDGAELRVLDRKDQWLQVVVSQNRVGWVRRDQVLMARS